MSRLRKDIKALELSKKQAKGRNLPADVLSTTNRKQIMIRRMRTMPTMTILPMTQKTNRDLSVIANTTRL